MLCVFPSKATCWVVCRKFRQTTFSFKFVYTLSIHLYPHTHEGCDLLQLVWSGSSCEFQSTHPRRVWPGMTKQIGISNPFQSTHPRRVWLSIYHPTKLYGLFQSTHPRRVWLFWATEGAQRECFNPHTHEGCDNILASLALSIIGFNPHTHEGCDFSERPRGRRESVSIHTPTKGVTISLHPLRYQL